MKLKKESNNIGFYEVFSDIIFATMAIFILLMTIFIVLAHESSPVTKALREVAELKKQQQKISQEILANQKSAKKIEKKIQSLSKKDIEILIAVDKSRSMEEELYNLKYAINQLVEILPTVADSIKLSIVAYRISEHGDDTEIFPMTEIVKKEFDNGKSINLVKNFLKSQRHKGGSAPILEATKVGLSQFSDINHFQGHQVFMLLGDVGPYEDSYAAPDNITNLGKSRAKELVKLLSSWTKQSKNRNLIILFSGRDEIYSRSIWQTNARKKKYQLSMQLFQEIAEKSGQKDAYTENQSNMLAHFLIAALKRK